MKNRIDMLFDRLNTLKDLHPNMIWEWDSVNGINIGRDGQTYVYVKCVCPEHYCYWDYNYATPHCKLSGMYKIEDGVYTLVGAMRKVTAMERMDWTRFDEISAKARAEQADVMRRVDEH